MQGDRRRLPIAQPESARAYRTGTERESMERSLRLSLPRPTGPTHTRRSSAVAPQKRSPGSRTPRGASAAPLQDPAAGTDFLTRGSSNPGLQGISGKLLDISVEPLSQGIGLSSVPGIAAGRGGRLRANKPHHVEMCSSLTVYMLALPYPTTHPTSRSPGKRADGGAGETPNGMFGNPKIMMKGGIDYEKKFSLMSDARLLANDIEFQRPPPPDHRFPVSPRSGTAHRSAHRVALSRPSV